MGVSNSENMLLSEKDHLNAVEFNFLVKPTTTGFELNSRECTEDQDQDRNSFGEDHRFDMSSSSSSSSTTIENNGGFKTPTSLDRKIPAVLKCPPAPRKPKPVPSAAMKRIRSSTAARRRVFLDVSAEIESLFPPAILADLIGGKIKKLRQGKNDGVLY